MLAALTGETRALAKLAVRALLSGAEIDFQIERTGADYLVVVREVCAEQILAEQEFPVAWRGLEEAMKLKLLVLWCAQILASADRCKRRTDAALRAIPRLPSLPDAGRRPKRRRQPPPG